MRLRSLSWLIGLASVGLPYAYIAYSDWRLQESNDPHAWKAALGDAIIAMFVVMLASALAALLNYVSLRSEGPRRWTRYIELWLMLAPSSAILLLPLFTMARTLVSH